MDNKVCFARLYSYDLPASGLTIYTMSFVDIFWTPPPQRILVPYIEANLLNYKVLFFPPLSEDLIKFREELERLVAIHNSTHRDLVWLRGQYSSHP